VKSFTQRAKNGKNARRYGGLGRLRPGTYLARVLATDAAGNRSRAVTVRFRVAGPART
jgi:hypothetical protein